MAEIKETPTIAPVLPTGTRNSIRRDGSRPAPRPEPRDERQAPRQGPDDEHRVDEYA